MSVWYISDNMTERITVVRLKEVSVLIYDPPGDAKNTSHLGNDAMVFKCLPIFLPSVEPSDLQVVHAAPIIF